MKKVYFLFLFMFSFVPLLFGQDHIHWGSTSDPHNGLTVTWHSTGTSNEIKWGYTALYEQGTFSGIRRDDYAGYLYDYTLPTVKASSTIHYAIFNNGTWTADRTFQTSVSPTSNHFSFIAGGDSRTNLSDWETAANKLATESVDFHLFLGDHVNRGSSKTDWNNWYTRGATFLGKNLIYHAGGNHEYGSIFLNQFVMPGNEKWYSLSFGNALFICLLSEQDFSAQHTWLVNELSTTTKTWKVVFFHKPFFTTGSHANDMNDYRTTWWKAFDDYGVDVVLGGHTHYYLRSKPINLNVNTDSAVDEYGSSPGQGRLQIVAGSYGAPLKGTGSGWFVEKNVSSMNYTKFEINDHILEMNAYNMSGTLIDSVTLQKQVTDVIVLETKTATGFTLSQNYPNPFNSETVIRFQIPRASDVILRIYNLLGHEIRTLSEESYPPGEHSISWDGKDNNGHSVSSGIYLYKLQSGDFSQVRKTTLLR